MKERGILFNGEMVRAILDGRKTMTRGVIKWPLEWSGARDDNENDPANWDTHFSANDGDPISLKEIVEKHPSQCLFGQPGDRLWVKETWRFLGTDMNKWGRNHRLQTGVFGYKADDTKSRIERPFQDIEKYMKTKQADDWRSSTHLPRWASRINLEITDVRVERVQEISDADCQREGIQSFTKDGTVTKFDIGDSLPWSTKERNPKQSFERLWGHTSKPEYSWDTNPWVWVIGFKKI